jgi:ubiquinone/menaquinone biosynthesis C-methylase UbiE
MQEVYERAAAELINSLPEHATVVDVGGGRRCHYADRRSPGSTVRIVAVDISEAELTDNLDVAEKIVADVTEALPFPESSVGLVTSRALLEHLRDSEAFVRNCARVLKPGGHLLTLFSSKFAPYALANQLLPDTVSRFLLHALIPDSRGRLGFPAYYDRTYYSKFREMLERQGLDVVAVKVSYYQSPYFEFFTPLFALSALYELCIYRLKLRNLAATVVVLARKRTP